VTRIIHILPEHVASQIAAGEVVERPASALKELAENALDAGAHTVNLELARGGAGLIAVTDDGCGMGREDAILALRRHATSKIRDAADLTAIRTLGFRGEALAAIASVSRMVLRTRRPGDDHGVEIVATGGEIEQVAACAMAPGTRIEVRELFFNTPARLKFLKTVATEQGAAAAAIQRLALANYRVAFNLSAEGRELIAAPRAAGALERMRQLWGPKIAERMLAFDYRNGAGRAWGLAATSQESFATPRMVFTFVNRRTVRDRLLARAAAQAYATLIPRGRHPAVVLFVELRADEVDVNVHPMKTEVRFRIPGAIFELVHHALRARLADQTGAPGGVSDRIAGTADDQDGMEPESGNAAGRDPRRLRLVAEAPAVRVGQRPLGLGYGSGRSVARSSGERVAAAAGNPAAALASAALEPAVLASALPAAATDDGAASPAAELRGARIPRYSELRVLGQLFAGYIVLEDDDGLLLVDQHAAHERVTFERLSAELRAGGVRAQALLVPATLELAPARAAMVMAGLAELRAIGFELEPFGPATLVLKGVPAVFAADGGMSLLADLIDGLGDHGLSARGAGAFEDLLKRLACHGSVRVGRVLAPGEITALLAELDATPFKSNCPHGRPVHIRFARNHIERLFRR
jgi:DNA mismatch repair protein MutL